MKKIGSWLLKYSDYYVGAIALICRKRGGLRAKRAEIKFPGR